MRSEAMRAGYSVKISSCEAEKIQGEGQVLIYSLGRERLSEKKTDQFEVCFRGGEAGVEKVLVLNVGQETIKAISARLGEFSRKFLQVSFTSLGVKLVWQEGIQAEQFELLDEELKACWKSCARL